MKYFLSYFTFSMYGNFLSMKIDIQATRRHSMRDCSIIASTVRIENET